MRKVLFIILILLLVISLIGNIFQYLFRPNPKQYPFLDPSVEEVSQSNRLINFMPLRTDLTNFIATQSAIGMYFEYIPTGVSIGINDKQPFVYASLLKIPLVMALYNKENQGGISLSDVETVTKDELNPGYGDLWKQGVGAKITIREAIRKSLVDSDDTAYNVLKSRVTADEFVRVFDFLDIPIDEQASEAAVTPKNYTSVLRSLLFSSYLPPEDSNDILQTLTQTTFTAGITSPIPKSIPVAHKFGIRRDLSYLSDCGIIYLPNRPYFLCVMENGKSIDEASSVIQQISAKVYTYLNAE